MVRSVGAQFGLLAFGLAILAGLYVGNPPATILLRAVVAATVACAVGQILAGVGKQVLRDHLQKRKLAIDQQHYEALRAMTRQEQAGASPAARGKAGS